MEMVRRRIVGRRGVSVFHVQDQTRSRVEICVGRANMIEMRIDADAPHVADAAVALFADFVISVKKAIDEGCPGPMRTNMRARRSDQMVTGLRPHLRALQTQSVAWQRAPRRASLAGWLCESRRAV